MAVVKRVFADISERQFFNMIQRAKIENAYVDEKGKVDIGKLVGTLIQTYGDGTYTILIKPEVKKVKAKQNQNGWVKGETNE